MRKKKKPEVCNCGNGTRRGGRRTLVSERQGHSLKERCWSAGDGRIWSLPASEKTLMKDFKLKIDECQKTLLGDTTNVSS